MGYRRDVLGCVQTESKSKIEMIINKALIGLCSEHVPLCCPGSIKRNNINQLLWEKLETLFLEISAISEAQK